MLDMLGMNPFSTICRQTSERFTGRITSTWRLVLVTACLFLPNSTALAIDAGMPNPPASPTTVNCGLMILDVIDVDDVNETFEAEVAIFASWHDPRLAFDAEAEGTHTKLFQGEFQFAEIFTGWWPQLLLINEIGRGDTNAIKIKVEADGSVTYLEQRNVLLETPMSLYDYPFDTQRLRALLVPFGNTSDEVVLEVDERYQRATDGYVQQEQGVNVSGWDLQKLEMATDRTKLYLGNVSKTISRITTTITLKRRSGQIVWDILVPLVVLVSMVWSIFWLDCEDLSDRLNISFIGVLTIVAYQFVVIDNMPRMAYLTFTDTLLLLSFLFTSATILQSLFLQRMVRKGRKAAADRIDRTCRWAFPLGYVLTAATLLAFYRLF
jgi:hypothetical protein